MEFLDSDYIRQLRYKYQENRNTSISIGSLNNSGNENHNNLSKNRNASQPLLRNGTEPRFEEIHSLTPPTSANLPRKNDRKKSSNSGLNNTNKTDSSWFARTVCFCLFGNQKNDFYQTSSSKRVSSPNQANNKANNNATIYEPINFDQIVETKLINEESSENNTKRKNNKKVRLQLNDETTAVVEQRASEIDMTTMDQVVFGLREDQFLNSSLSDKFNSDSDYIDLSFKSNEVNNADEECK